MRGVLKSFFTINPATLSCLTIVFVVVLLMVEIPLLNLIEMKTYDLRFLSRGRLNPAPDVVLAVIDEKSLDEEGRWPWPRSKIGALVDILSREGARVIGFDIGFLEPDENSRLQFIQQFDRKVAALNLENRELSGFIDASRKAADNDQTLARAIKNSSAKVILGYFFHMTAAELDYEIESTAINGQLERIGPSKYPLILYEGDETASFPFIRAHAPEGNLKALTDAADGSGYFSLAADPDGVVRWMPLIIQCGEHVFPPLAVLCTWHYLDQPQLMVKMSPYGVKEIRMGDRSIPTDEYGQLLVNYLGPAKTFPHVSINDILSGRAAKDVFKDKIVLVGATATGTYDLRTTPLGAVYPGMEIHATVIDNILTGRYNVRPRWSRIFDLIAIVVLCVLTGVLLPRMSALRGSLLTAGLFAAHVVAARWFFVHAGMWLNIIYPLLALSINYTVLTLYYYVTEERQRKMIKGAFRHYVAPLVVEEMLKSPDQLTLGGEEREISVLFCDLEGFTSYSERYSPQEMIDTLSDYFEKMTEQIFVFQGTLKGYVGDELMAIFGAPLAHADHADRACAAALAMRENLQILCSEWAAVGRPPLRARTGINSGKMIVGNLGSRYRFTYDALGDQVNLGSRIEGINKVYGTEILIGENTAKLLGDSFLLREVDTVRVVGRQQCLSVHELVAKTGTSLPENLTQALRIYADGLAAYRLHRWLDALAIFNQALEFKPEDGPALTMARRCQSYLKSPPPEDWDCVFDQLSK